jgi:hypothetical protein
MNLNLLLYKNLKVAFPDVLYIEVEHFINSMRKRKYRAG